VDESEEVIYIDHDHLHMVGNVEPGVGTGVVAGAASDAT
jgi:hypothetical protein